MAGLRRRRASSSEGSHWDAASWRAAAASGPTGLAEPLLAPNEAGGGVGAARGERERLFFAQLLRALVTGWRRLLEGVNGIVKGVSGVVVRGKNGAAELRREPLELSALAAGRLRALVARAAVPFNSGDSDHRAALARLWTAAFPRDLPSEGGPSERWKDMGWQGKDPATDFRGGGVLGLDNLIGLHTHFPRTFAALLHKTRGSRAEIEYPFAVAGVNISFQLMTMLGLRDPALVAALTEGADNGSGTGVDNGGAQPAEPGGAVVPAHAAPEELHAFAEALSVPGPHGARALDSLYAFTFEALDSKWLLSQDVMEFNATLAQAVAVTNAALVARDDHSLRFTDIVS